MISNQVPWRHIPKYITAIASKLTDSEECCYMITSKERMMWTTYKGAEESRPIITHQGSVRNLWRTLDKRHFQRGVHSSRNLVKGMARSSSSQAPRIRWYVCKLDNQLERNCLQRREIKRKEQSCTNGRAMSLGRETKCFSFNGLGIRCIDTEMYLKFTHNKENTWEVRNKHFQIMIFECKGQRKSDKINLNFVSSVWIRSLKK